MSITASLLTLFVAACSTTVTVPQPVNGIKAALVDHGRHASLVLARKGGMVRYAYGDWRYYALASTGAGETSRAALLPTQAGLGRRMWSGPVQKEAIAARLVEGSEEIYVFQVERSKALRLRRELDALYHANLTSLHENSLYDLSFVHHPQSYTLTNNSNRKVAEWLEDLGCEISGPAYWSIWKIEQ